MLWFFQVIVSFCFVLFCFVQVCTSSKSRSDQQEYTITQALFSPHIPKSVWGPLSGPINQPAGQVEAAYLGFLCVWKTAVMTAITGNQAQVCAS